MHFWFFSLKKKKNTNKSLTRLCLLFRRRLFLSRNLCCGVFGIFAISRRIVANRGEDERLRSFQGYHFHVFLLRHLQQIAVRISWFPLPACPEKLAHIEAREWMCFRVKNDLIQGKKVVGREQKEERFKSFG